MQLCDIQGCNKTNSLIDLEEPESQDLSRRKGYQIKKICKNHHFVWFKSGKTKAEEFCVDPWGTHLTNAKPNCIVKEELYQDILALQSTDFKPVYVGNNLCKHCFEKFKNLTLENIAKEEESSMEVISQASSASNTGFTQEDKLKKLNEFLDGYNIKNIQRNSTVSHIEDALDELKHQVLADFGLSAAPVQENELINNIKIAVDQSEKYSEKTKLLTLLLESWSSKKLSETFNVSWQPTIQ